MKRLVLVLALLAVFMSTGSFAAADEDERDWGGPPPICC